MPIRVPRTVLQQDPTTPQSAQRIVPVQAIGNPAAAAVAPAQRAAGLAAQIYQEDRDREIATHVTELDVQRRQADAQAINGYLQLQGKDAVEARGDALAAIDANSKAVRTGIKDRAVADLWKKQDAALTLAAQSELDAHYRQQRTKWEADTQEARADVLVSDLGRVAFGEGYDPATGRLSREAERTRSAYQDAIGELGRGLGWSPEQVEAARRRADTKAHQGVAEQLIDGERFDEADKFLESNKDRIDPTVQARLGKESRDGARRKAAELHTQAIAEKAQTFALRTSDLAVTHGTTIAEQQAWAESTAEFSYRGGKLTAPEYDAVLQRLDRHYKMRDAQQAATDKQTVLDAEKFLNEHPFSTLDDSPKLFEAAKRSGHLPALLEFQSSGRYATDPDYLAQVRAIPDEDLQRIAPDRLWVTLRPRLSNRDLDDVMARHARARNEATADQLHGISVDDRIEATARSLGILPADPKAKLNPDQKREFDAWRVRVDGDLRAKQAELGKKATTQDLQKLLDLQAKDYVDVVRPGYLWNSTDRVPLSRLPDRSTASVVVGGDRIALNRVGERYWTAIAAFLASKGAEPTAANIVERWVAIGKPGDTAATPAAAAAAAPAPAQPYQPVNPMTAAGQWQDEFYWRGRGLRAGGR